MLKNTLLFGFGFGPGLDRSMAKGAGGFGAWPPKSQALENSPG